MDVPYLNTAFHNVRSHSTALVAMFLLIFNSQLIVREIHAGANDGFLNRAVAEWSTFSPTQKLGAIMSAIAHSKVYRFLKSDAPSLTWTSLTASRDDNFTKPGSPPRPFALCKACSAI